MSVLNCLRQWLLTCPLLEGQRLNVNFLGPDALDFDLVENPVPPILSTYLDGSTIRQKAVSLTSVQDYSQDLLEQISASGFWEEVTEWITARDEAGDLPQLDDGRTATGISVTSAPYLFSTTATTARYQLQLLLIYEQEPDNP